MFESCKLAFNLGTELNAMVEILMKDRIEQEALREGVLSFIQVYSQNERVGEYQEFFQTAYCYFYQTDLQNNIRDTWGSMLLRKLERWAQKKIEMF